MLIVALALAGIVAGEVPEVPAPPAVDTSDRIHAYVKRCQDAGGLTALTLDDDSQVVRFVCVAPALRRIKIDETKEEK